MDKMRFLLMGVMAGLLGVSTALAEEAAAPAEKKAKAPGGREATFAAVDTNADGVLSLEEYTAMDAKRLEARKARLGDKFDAEKAAKMPSAGARFKARDKDGNGTLSKEEFFGGAAKKPRPEEKKVKPVQDAAAGAVK